MLIDFENIGYVKCDNILLPTESSYIPASTWGFIKGDITEQKDLMKLINNIEVGLTPEQIELLSNTSNIINEFKTDYYTKREVDNIISNIEVGDVDLTGYATEQWVRNQGYLTEHQSLVDYAKKQWVLDNYYLKGDIDELLNDTKDDTKDWVNEQGFIQAGNLDLYLSDYYTKSDIDSNNFATVDFVTSQGYLSESTLLTDYYTKEEIDNAFNSLEIGLTPEQIEIINNLDGVISGFETDIAELTEELGNKVDWESFDGELTNIYDTVSSVIDVDDFSELDVADLYNRADGNITIRKGDKNYKILQSYQSGAGFLEDYNVILCDFSDNNIIYKISSRNGISEIDLSNGNVDLSDYYTKEEVDNAISNIELSIPPELREALEGISDIQNEVALKANISDVYTKEEIDNKGYLTEHQDLTGYATESWVSSKYVTRDVEGLKYYYHKNKFFTGTQAEWDALTPEQQSTYIIAMITE